MAYDNERSKLLDLHSHVYTNDQSVDVHKVPNDFNNPIVEAAVKTGRISFQSSVKLE